MFGTTEKGALADLALAKDGDARAQHRAALYCYEKYLPRLRRLATKNDDPAVSVDDMESMFFEGCMRAVLIVDERGDPLYHVGQRGIWAVQSAMRAIRRSTRLQVKVWAGMDEDRDPMAQIHDPRAADAFERADDALVAQQRVHVLTTAPLKARLREAVEVIMSGGAGDPREMGFNQRLATAMGVSPQRASQVVAELRTHVQ